MTIEQMIEEKKRQGFSNKMIAELSGVPYGTVQKIFGGETTSPRYETIQALQKFFEECAGESRKGDKTLEDYLALPEGARVEMINGEFYDMAAPTTEHQDIAGELFVELKNHVRKNMGGCHPFIAPVDVQLDCDDKTMVQPDVMIVCDKNKITKSRIVGAPDFIAEVLSPTNIFMDTAIKLSKYEKAGVREYWVISPELEKVLVNVFERDEAPKEYTFDDDIPVAIWNGECVISFRKLLEY
jgi:Uma2 family endonuclease